MEFLDSTIRFESTLNLPRKLYNPLRHIDHKIMFAVCLSLKKRHQIGSSSYIYNVVCSFSMSPAQRDETETVHLYNLCLGMCLSVCSSNITNDVFRYQIKMESQHHE